jgi:hypothetical protein
MEEPMEGEPARSRAVIDMLTIANEYCLFFEGAEKYSAKDILVYFQRIAPLLYLKGSLLPDIEDGEDLVADRYVSEEQWESLFNTLTLKLGNSAKYYVHNQTYDTIEANLPENMADIYQDMKDFTMQYQRNTLEAHRQAVSQLKDLFPNRWGMILANAILAVHQKLHQEQLDSAVFEADNDWS